MKKNHEKVAALIQEAIHAIGYDNSLAGAKNQLLLALQNVERVAGKRVKREDYRQFYEKLAKDKAKIWWEMVKKNAAQNPEGFTQ